MDLNVSAHRALGDYCHGPIGTTFYPPRTKKKKKKTLGDTLRFYCLSENEFLLCHVNLQRIRGRSCRKSHQKVVQFYDSSTFSSVHAALQKSCTRCKG